MHEHLDDRDHLFISWPPFRWPRQVHNKIHRVDERSVHEVGGDVRSCASPVAQGPQAVVTPTGAECHLYTGALLAGTGPRLGGGEDRT